MTECGVASASVAAPFPGDGGALPCPLRIDGTVDPVHTALDFQVTGDGVNILLARNISLHASIKNVGQMM